MRCQICDKTRTDEPDYNPLQVILGHPFGWYSGDDGEMCPGCFTAIYTGANQ